MDDNQTDSGAKEEAVVSGGKTKERTYEDVLGILEEETKKEEGVMTTPPPIAAEKEEVKDDLIPEKEIENDLAEVKMEEPVASPPVVPVDGFSEAKKMEPGEGAGGVSSEPPVKVPQGFVSRTSDEEVARARGSLPGEVKEESVDQINEGRVSQKKKFPWGVIVVILVLVLGTLLAFIFFGPLDMEKIGKMTGGGEVVKEEGTNEEGGMMIEEEIPEGTESGKGGLPVGELSYENENLGFFVKYSAERQVMEDANSRAGNRIVFWLSSGLNIVIHAGEVWSYDNPERVEEAYTSTIAGVKAYEFTGDANQRIIDFEKNGIKYTIQCVHQRDEGVLKECSDFLDSFRFIGQD
jgi:hypothetical protein